MKIIFRTAALAALVVAASCGKDKVDAIAEQLEEQAEQLENTPLEANAVTDNVVIPGGSKKEGVPPTPNNAISLDVSAAGKTAFLNEGFEIPIKSDGDIVGAYLQFKSKDGILGEGYHDIDIASNTTAAKTTANKNSIRSKIKKGTLRTTSKVDDVNLDIDFNAKIEPGTFCYVICVYDGEGNISAPSEVCVTVESWGGSSAVVGKWSLVKEEYSEEGESKVFNVGDPDCDEWTASCPENQGEFEISVCYTQEYGSLELKSDGSFAIDFKGMDGNYDYEASQLACEAIYKDPTVYRSKQRKLGLRSR